MARSDQTNSSSPATNDNSKNDAPARVHSIYENPQYEREAAASMIDAIRATGGSMKGKLRGF